ncbi:MAG: hypothetical protein KF823_10485 [Xanthomonadales bacterium]|nr:hypothetical protein [Xanthomonadales bacterium]
MPTRAAAALVLAALLPLLHGCAALVGRATSNLAGNLSAGIENHDDPETVATALPAYLLMLDGLIEGSPDSPGLLVAGARLYGVYAGVFVDQPARARRLARRAYDYAGRAFCPTHPGICASRGQPFETFEAQVAQLPGRDLEGLYAYAAAWAGMIQADSGDWALIAEIPKVDALLRRVVELDSEHAGGQPWLYLGVLATLLPPAYGGRPEDGQAHFERALALSGGRNQMARVLYAQHYTRLVFDRELHDRLVAEVLTADPRAPGLTLVNVLAQQRAAELRDSADDYF